jgi:glucose/arabinose dehydrogenase
MMCVPRSTNTTRTARASVFLQRAFETLSALTLQPGTNTVWTAVNERDGLGDDLVPDYATSVKDGGFYGWPYSYIGNHVDTRVANQKPDLVAKAIVPDVLIPAHSAALGLTFYTGTQFPQRYRNGLFVALHGSWNRSATEGCESHLRSVCQQQAVGSDRGFRHRIRGESDSEFKVGPARGCDRDAGRFLAGIR